MPFVGARYSFFSGARVHPRHGQGCPAPRDGADAGADQSSACDLDEAGRLQTAAAEPDAAEPEAEQA
jgi:hypothetical protein